jgi:hypothetical protein
MHKKNFPLHTIEFTFDNKCIKRIEIPFSGEAPNAFGHIVYDKLCISMINANQEYVSIREHKVSFEYLDLLEMLPTKRTIRDDELKGIKDAMVLKNLGRANHGLDYLVNILSKKSGYSEIEIIKMAGK